MNELNSSDVLDMPTDIKTYLPVADGLPLESKGCIDWPICKPADVCSKGITLLPLGYNPPWNPLYRFIPKSARGVSPRYVRVQSVEDETMHSAGGGGVDDPILICTETV